MHASSVIGKLMVYTLLVFPRIKQHEPNYSKLCSTIPATHTQRQTDRQKQTDRPTDTHTQTHTLMMNLSSLCGLCALAPDTETSLAGGWTSVVIRWPVTGWMVYLTPPSVRGPPGPRLSTSPVQISSKCVSQERCASCA